ncbi:MAG: hypothetical protein H0Z35_12910 [Thermoanaerobacteraceae bacterium]|nr:hypothetical protein [Thermoanaerobacteraceae bacterium]
MSKRVLVLLAVILLIASGCAKQSQSFAERDIYNHPTAGFSIQVPAGWEKVAETDFGAEFVDPENGIAANFLLEIGGLGYYTAEQLADEIIKAFKNNESFQDVEVVVKERSNIDSNVYRVIFESTGPGGTALATKAFIFDIETGIRYYLLFTAREDTYYLYDYEFEDIAETFMTTKQPKELYKLMPESDLPGGHPDIKSGRQPEAEPETGTNKEQ